MKKKRAPRLDRIHIVWSIVIVILVCFSGVAVWRLVRLLPKENARERLEGSIVRQGKWFAKNQTEEGDFVYERISASGEVKEGHNMVRQAGALYGLGQLYAHTKDPEVAATIEKGLGYFREITATMSAEASAITYNEVTNTNTTALLVLGLVEYLEVDEALQTTENLEYLVRLSNYLVSTQTSTGAYINTYKPTPSESDYNNGETMYALIRSYRLTRKQPYLLSVKRMANYAIFHYGPRDYNSSFFSWGMAGFAHLYQVEPDEKYWEFMRAYAVKYMVSRGNGYEQYLSGKTKEPIIPSASVFLEGVSHIAWIAKEKDVSFSNMLTRHTQRVLQHLLMYEINSPYGAFVSESDVVTGAVCATVGCETTRIDFLQHNMSAIILYFRFLSGSV